MSLQKNHESTYYSDFDDDFGLWALDFLGLGWAYGLVFWALNWFGHRLLDCSAVAVIVFQLSVPSSGGDCFTNSFNVSSIAAFGWWTG
ncbi:hypothetical protein AYI68_g4602 [Smittium mucronatum]|uniref:Uncharacterized protein n=1 Tax=Smittium mucronatum TaxID=133383 RepID=A0A1R0GWM8_9FUNG|nr:hypothetical protein AYI68_g4602 [Smittium mucronatum]